MRVVAKIQYKMMLRFPVSVRAGALLAALFCFFPNSAQALWNGHASSNSGFTVLLKISGARRLDCSGAMIGPRLVLTAGHCLLGARGVNARIGNESVEVENWIVNPQWSAGLPVNGWDARINAGNGDRYVDLAVLLLARAPSNGQAISLADSSTGKQSALTTYGYARGSMLEPLYKIDMSDASLMQRLSPRGPFKLYAAGGSAWCQGDSGGPVTRTEGSEEKLVGIVGLGLGAIAHDPASAVAMRWGGASRIPKCGSYAYAQDVRLHADWIAQASSALTNDAPATASTGKSRHAAAEDVLPADEFDEDELSGRM